MCPICPSKLFNHRSLYKYICTQTKKNIAEQQMIISLIRLLDNCHWSAVKVLPDHLLSSTGSKFGKVWLVSYGRIHLVHLRIHKYLTDDSTVNFHDKFFLHFLLKFRKKWRKNLSWKFIDESSVKYLRIRK